MTERPASTANATGTAIERMPEPENIVPVQLIGLRREMAALIEDRVREWELIVRLARRVEEGFADLRSEL